MSETTDNSKAGGRCAPALGSGTALHCDHVGWGMNAILMTPVVAMTSAASVAIPAMQYPAGAIMGIWLSMWLVVLWAWLTRNSPNDKLSHGHPTTQNEMI